MCVSLFCDTDVRKMVVLGMCIAEAASVFPTGASIGLKYPVTKMQKCALVLVSLRRWLDLVGACSCFLWYMLVKLLRGLALSAGVHFHSLCILRVCFLFYFEKIFPCISQLTLLPVFVLLRT